MNEVPGQLCLNKKDVESCILNLIFSRLKFLPNLVISQMWVNKSGTYCTKHLVWYAAVGLDTNSWYRGLQKQIKNKLQTSQNRVIRFILGYDSRQHHYCADFVKLGWLDISHRVDYLALSLMYSIVHNTAPSYLCNLEKVKHSYGTRWSNCSFTIPKVKTQGSLSFKYNSIKLWNSLPLYIKKAETKDDFKHKCKIFFKDTMIKEESNGQAI